jgi:mono/diheme cytochrome c family protein
MLALALSAGVARAGAAADAVTAELMQRGEYLAHAGNCVACHSVRGGAAYAGGLKMALPFGTIYATNITPDPDTGIGRYSLQDFDRAMRRGIARDGHYLYPSMPYPSYAKLQQADIRALYAYFMQGVTPVHQPNHPSDISWPLNARWPLAIWNFLFLDNKPYANQPAHDAAWNRGAYLVQGLGHCGACHTPRALLGEEKALSDSNSNYLSGAAIDNWSAPDLSGDAVTGLGGWNEPELAAYFKTGHSRHGNAFGSMIDVINYSTEYLSAEDNTAMAHYLKALPPARPDEAQRWSYEAATAEALKSAHFEQPGSLTYWQRCAACHLQTGAGFDPFLPSLAGNAVVLDRDPTSLINVVLNGSSPLVVGGVTDQYRMVPFRLMLDDQQIADVVSYIRSRCRASAATPRRFATRNLMCCACAKRLISRRRAAARPWA